jgi:hypothetical protein
LQPAASGSPRRPLCSRHGWRALLRTQFVHRLDLHNAQNMARWLGSSRLQTVGPIRCLAGQSCADKGRTSTFVLGKLHSQFYELAIIKWEFEDHALTYELGLVRTREGNALAVGARGHERNCGFPPCLLGQKAWRGVSKRESYLNNEIGGTKHDGDTGYLYLPHLKNF